MAVTDSVKVLIDYVIEPIVGDVIVLASLVAPVKLSSLHFTTHSLNNVDVLLWDPWPWLRSN
jgi:hypothetical protein